MDIGMPGLSCFEATRRIRKNRPDTKVLFLTMYDDEDYLVEGMEVDASGYVLKDSPTQQLIAAVRDILRGGSYLSAGTCRPVPPQPCVQSPRADRPERPS